MKKICILGVLFISLFSFVSCDEIFSNLEDKFEEVLNEESVVGTWTYQSEGYSEQFTFHSDGTGMRVSTDSADVRTVSFDYVYDADNQRIILVSDDAHLIMTIREYSDDEMKVVCLENNVEKYWILRKNIEEDDVVDQEQTDSTLLGTWVYETGSYTEKYVFQANGVGEYITITPYETQTERFDYVYDSLNGKILFRFGDEFAIMSVQNISDSELNVLYQENGGSDGYNMILYREQNDDTGDEDDDSLTTAFFLGTWAFYGEDYTDKFTFNADGSGIYFSIDSYEQFREDFKYSYDVQKNTIVIFIGSMQITLEIQRYTSNEMSVIVYELGESETWTLVREE